MRYHLDMPFGLRDQIDTAPHHYDNPRAGGDLTAAAWVFTPDWQQVLLVDHPRFGWSPPGGHVEPGEHPAAASVRELREETGVQASPLHGVPIAASGNHEMVCLAYAFTVRSSTPLVEEDGRAVRWFPLADYPTGVVFPDDARRLRRAAAALADGIALPDISGTDVVTLMDHALGHAVDPTELRFAAQAAALAGDRLNRKRGVYIDIAAVA